MWQCSTYFFCLFFIPPRYLSIENGMRANANRHQVCKQKTRLLCEIPTHSGSMPISAVLNVKQLNLSQQLLDRLWLIQLTDCYFYNYFMVRCWFWSFFSTLRLWISDKANNAKENKETRIKHPKIYKQKKAFV